MQSSVVGLFRKSLFLILAVSVLNTLLPLDSVTAQEKGSIQRQVRVLYRLTDVVVRDRDGNFVKGLKPEDFRLLIDGIEVPVKSVEEFNSVSPKAKSVESYVVEAKKAKAEGVEPPPPPSPPRHVILVFDLFNSGPQGLRAAKETAINLLDTAFLPYDRLTVFQYNNSLKHLIGPTTDREKIREIIESVRGPSQNDYYKPSREEIYPPKDAMDEGRIKLINMEKRANFRNFLDALRELSDALAFLPGRKSYLIFSEGPNIYDPLNNIDSIEEIVKTAEEMRVGGAEDLGDSTNRAAGTPEGSLETRSDQGGIDGYVASSNSTFYTIRRGPIQPPWTLGAEIDLRDDQIAVIESSEPEIDENGDVVTETSSNTNIVGGANAVLKTNATVKLNDMQRGRLDILRDVARMTNGKFYDAGMNDERLAETLVEEIGNFYLLGFSVPQQVANKFYKLKIETRDKSLSVVYRKGFSSGKEFKDLTADERELEINRALVAGAGTNQLELETKVYQMPFSDKATALYYFQVNPELVKADDSGKREIEMLLSVEDDKGNLCYRQHKMYRSSSAGESGGSLWSSENIPLLPEGTVVSLSLRDNGSGKIATSKTKLSHKAGEGSSLVMTEPIFTEAQTTGDIGAWDSNVIKDNVPIQKPSTFLLLKAPGKPIYDNAFEQGTYAAVMFLVTNLPDDFDPASMNLYASFSLDAGEGGKYLMTAEGESIKLISNLGAIAYSAKLPVGYAQQESGSIIIEVEGLSDVTLTTKVPYKIRDFSEEKAAESAKSGLLLKIGI